MMASRDIRHVMDSHTGTNAMSSAAVDIGSMWAAARGLCLRARAGHGQTDIGKYPRTRHLEGARLQLGDLAGDKRGKDRAGETFVVEAKLDGGPCAIAFDHGGNLLLQCRGHCLTGGARLLLERHHHQPAGAGQDPVIGAGLQREGRDRLPRGAAHPPVSPEPRPRERGAPVGPGRVDPKTGTARPLRSPTHSLHPAGDRLGGLGLIPRKGDRA